MAQLFLTFSFYVLFVTAQSNFESAVKYYDNLIKSEQIRSASYSSPNNSNAHRPTSNNTVSDFGTFDYIVVGAGSAGAIIANRLSENPNARVLLLEAGGVETDFTDIPGMGAVSLALEYNWNYFTTPQTTSCLGMVNKQCSYPRGKGVGGSSIVNGLLYTRGNKQDYNNWCNQGNPGWCFHDVLPFFKKSENSKIEGDIGYHGFGGYLNVEYVQPDSTFYPTFFEANREMGRNIVDYNGKYQLGVGKAQVNSIGGRRGSTGRAFLRPIFNRKNLKILIWSYVIKILISEDGKRAHGVLFSKNSHLFKASARNDIIISAGTIGSPQLLMLSGIGPKFHLQKLAIPVIQDLPVGNYFRDHAAYSGLHIVTNVTEKVQDLEDLIYDYLNSKGPLTSGAAFALGFLQTNLSQVQGFPDIEVAVSVFSNLKPYSDKFFNLNEETYKYGFFQINPVPSFTMHVILLHPKSTGNLRLKSADPFSYPFIDSRIFTDDDNEDIETLVLSN